MKIILLSAILFVSISVKGQETLQPQSLKEFIQKVTGNKGTNEEKTRKLVRWINTNFKWSYTDYQKRTVEEIIQRKAGNCAELANVLAALLTEMNIKFRWIAEINIQPRKENRLKTAMQKVTENGKGMSVFGLMHNDHVWLEVQNEKDKSWFPADPAVGVVGMNEWISARMKFNERTISPIPEVAKVVEEMFVPFVVVAKEKRNSKPSEIRSQFYLIEGFNSFYKKKLTKLEVWQEWSEKIVNFADTGRDAFAGEVNLHEREKDIEEIWATYQKLKEEATKQNLSKTSPKEIAINELLELHKLQRDAHFNRDAKLLVSIMDENFMEISNGKINSPKKEDMIKRFQSYFDSVTFMEWDDIKPPIVKISDDLTLAYMLVSKRVRLKTKENNEQTTIFAWTSTFRKIKGKWMMTSIASTAENR
jgi:hypothetical protein